MKNPNIVIAYHAKCMDGFAAAAIAKQWWESQESSNVVVLPVDYTQPIPILPLSLLGKDIYRLIYVDFAPEPDFLFGLLDNPLYREIQVLDHHATGIALYTPEVRVALGAHTYQLDTPFPVTVQRVELTLDESYSGAGLAWVKYHPREPIPWVFANIQDRDLWKFNLPNSRLYHPYFCLFLAREDFDGLYLLNNQDPDTITPIAETLQQSHDLIVKEVAVANTVVHFVKIRVGPAWLPIQIPYTNATYQMRSEVGNITNVGVNFSVVWWMSAKGLHLSLRSEKTGADVSKLAWHLGGGGHRNAAGIEMVGVWDIAEAQLGIEILLDTPTIVEECGIKYIPLGPAE